MTTLYKIYVGLNDQQTKKQEIDTVTAMDIISTYLANHFEGATVYNGIGVYKHEDGTIVKENSLIIELVYVEDYQVINLINHVKEILNQESIMKVKIKCDCDFC